MRVDFDVPFVKGKARPRFNAKTRTAYNTTDTKAAENAIALAYKSESIRRYGGVVKAPQGVSVAVSIETYRQLPKSTKKSVASAPDVFKPDVDNIAKLVFDALNGIAYEDDAQINEFYIRKHDRARRKARTLVIVGWED